MLNKQSIRILRYIYRHKTVTRGQLLMKFANSDTESLLDGILSPYVSVNNYESQERDGFTYHRITVDSTYKLNSDGESIVESTRWFNTEYIVSHIVIPILLAVISTLITLFLTNALSLVR